MDLESESLNLECVDDNVGNSVVESGECNKGTHEKIDLKLENNGSCSNDDGVLGGSGNAVDSGKTVSLELGREESKIGKPKNSPQVASESLGVLGGLPKGYGLKKWRRVRREVVKDGSPPVDSGKALKRVLSVSGNPMRPSVQSVEATQKSEGSVGSVNMLEKDTKSSNYFKTGGSNLDHRLVAGSGFDVGTDSENSEDRGSKSSTAASAPKMRHDVAMVSGYARDRNRVMNMSGKNLSNSIQKAQQGKGRIETSKKPRGGERIKIEKENSHSSIESDSISSNFVFVQGAFSATSNGRKSISYDGENSDEAQASERLFSDDVETSYNNENVVGGRPRGDLAPNLYWEGKEKKGENHPPSASPDPFVQSAIMLQTLQEALEKEVEKFREIGKDSSISSAESEVHPSPSDQLGSEDIGQDAFSSFETQIRSLKQEVTSLESRLVEARAALEVKESRIAELEDSLNTTKSPKENSGNTIEQEIIREMELKIEGLFKQKIEAEVECLATAMTVQDLRAQAGNQTLLPEEQKALVKEQAQLLTKFKAAESKAVLLEKQTKDLDTYCEDIRVTEEVLTMQKRVFKVTWCLATQLILLLVLFGLIVSQLHPPSGEDVPT